MTYILNQMEARDIGDRKDKETDKTKPYKHRKIEGSLTMFNML